MAYTELSSNINELLGESFRQILPASGLTDFLVQYALPILTVLTILVMLLLLLLSIFLDAIVDVWKLPIAIALDALKFLGLYNPWLAVFSAVVGGIAFIAISGARWMRWPFAIISILAAVAVLPNFYGGTTTGIIIAILPINSLFMFISAIVD